MLDINLYMQYLLSTYYVYRIIVRAAMWVSLVSLLPRTFHMFLLAGPEPMAGSKEGLPG